MGCINWEVLLQLTKNIPNNLDKQKPREEIPGDVREYVKLRDKICRVCGSSKDLVIHHIIPNGPSTPDNLILLCRRCHYVVHLLLWIDGKWKYPTKYQF